MNRKIIIVTFMVALLSFSLFGCKGKSQVITEDFNSTVWVDENSGTSLLFIDKDLTVVSGEIKLDMNAEDIENVKYEPNKYEDVEIILKGKSIEISNENGLIMEFEKVSDTKMKDSYETVFIKTNMK